MKVIREFFNNHVAIFFILPALLGTFIFILIPVICSFGLSFTKWNLLNSIQFIGFDNYVELFKDKIFYKIL